MSSNLKDQLIRLGEERPDLRSHLRPVLDLLSKSSSDKSADARHQYNQDGLRMSGQEWGYIFDYKATGVDPGIDADGRYVISVRSKSEEALGKFLRSCQESIHEYVEDPDNWHNIRWPAFGVKFPLKKEEVTEWVEKEEDVLEDRMRDQVLSPDPDKTMDEVMNEALAEGPITNTVPRKRIKETVHPDFLANIVGWMRRNASMAYDLYMHIETGGNVESFMETFHDPQNAIKEMDIAKRVRELNDVIMENVHEEIGRIRERALTDLMEDEVGRSVMRVADDLVFDIKNSDVEFEGKQKLLKKMGSLEKDYYNATTAADLEAMKRKTRSCFDLLVEISNKGDRGPGHPVTELLGPPSTGLDELEVTLRHAAEKVRSGDLFERR